MKLKFNKNFIDITGNKYGRLTVLKVSHKIKKTVFWHVVCSCGNKKIVRSGCLKNGHTKSCGCIKKEIEAKRFATHGKSGTPEYNTWCNMKHRCFSDKKNKHYERYSKRGITVCDRWANSFENFFEDMGERPSTLHSIDRIDNDGDYEPSNCRWATIREQSLNKRNNAFFTYKGETLTMTEWCDRSNINVGAFTTRLKLGWDISKIIETPLRKISKKIKLSYNGETRYLKEWSERTGIAVPTLKNRINRGWSSEKILETPVKDVGWNK